MCYITSVARGRSGRIVVEVDPELKLELYTALTYKGLTLKAWFVEEAQNYINQHRQPLLFHRSTASSRPERETEGSGENQ